jgi:segregation and condensation protein A
MAAEDKIMEMIYKDYSWEQVIYEIIAMEGLDPWALDIQALSDSFMDYIGSLSEVDFKIPAKYIIIASVLLRMKADYLNFLEAQEEEAAEIDSGALEIEGGNGLTTINPLLIPPRRRPERRILVEDLISALRKVMRTETRKELRLRSVESRIQIIDDKITERISNLYKKINSLLAKIKKEEIPFSNLVEKWEKNEILNTFMPLIYLDHDRKVNCRQEEFFKEIYVKKGEKAK